MPLASAYRFCRLTAVLLAALAQPASALDPVGVAQSEQPFLIDGDPVPGNATVFAGEAVSSYLLPLRVRLSAGHSVLLGPGSQARFARDMILFDGVSAAFQAAAGEVLTVELGALRFRTAPGGGGALYADRPGVAAAWAVGSPLEVYAGSGEPAVLAPQTAAAFSIDGGALLVQPERAPVEMARIQIRQLKHLEQLSATRPAVLPRTKALLSRLADASGGLFRLGGEDDQQEPVRLDSKRLLEAVFEIHPRLLTGAWADSGCGSPDCISRKPVQRPADFSGWAATAPLAEFGCALCRRAGLGIPGDTGVLE